MMVRTGTAVVIRVIMARARLACLPLAHSTQVVMREIVQQQIPGTWWQHSAEVVQYWLGARSEIWDFREITEEIRSNSRRRKTLLGSYRKRVVMPRVRAADLHWFRTGIQSKGVGGLVPFQSIAPPLRPWSTSVKHLRWGRVMWRFFRAWTIARITGRLPLCVWDDQALEAVLARCPACGMNVVGLRHVLCNCVFNADLRHALPFVEGGLLQWSLTGCRDVATLRMKVRFVGLCCARVAHLRRSGCGGAEEGVGA
jgi:hypothetical protein